MMFQVALERGCRLELYIEMPDRESVVRLLTLMAAKYDAQDGKETKILYVRHISG